MGLEIVGKLRDAASMFWASLDTNEKAVLLYGAGYVALNLALVVRAVTRQRQLDIVLEHVQANLEARGVTRGAV